jgi:hypothetical protein
VAEQLLESLRSHAAWILYCAKRPDHYGLDLPRALRSVLSSGDSANEFDAAHSRAAAGVEHKMRII